MPELAYLDAFRSEQCISISIKNNDSADYSNAPVFADIPIDQVQSLGCSFDQMRLEDDQGNPVTFWPDAGGREVYPGYHSIWFRIDLPASGTRNLKLYCDPDNPTITSNPLDVVDEYFGMDDQSKFSMFDQHSKIDDQIYLDPPASLCVLCKDEGVTNTDVNDLLHFDYKDRFIVKVNWYMEAQGAGHILAFLAKVSDTYDWAGPYVWYGSSSPWSGYGSNIGYYDSSYHVLGQYQTDGKWHRVLELVRADQQNFDLYYDDSALGTGLNFIQGHQSFDSSQDLYVLFKESTKSTLDISNNHVDTYVVTSVPYASLPSVSTSFVRMINMSCIKFPYELL